MRLCPALLAVCMVAGCSRPESYTPLPTAYPRINTYADSTASAALPGLCFDINAEADTSRPRHDWLNIAYPRYGATIYVTARQISSPDSLAAAIDARIERMALNLGERKAEMTEFDNAHGFRCRLLVCPDGGPVPVQFLAFDRKGSLLSGTAVLHGSSEPADSVFPIVESLGKDAAAILNSLQ